MRVLICVCLCLLSAVQVVGQVDKVAKPLKLSFETGYSASHFFESGQLSNVYQPKYIKERSYIGFNISKNQMKYFIDYRFFNSNKQYNAQLVAEPVSYSKEKFTPRSYQMLEAGCARIFPLPFKSRLETGLSISYMNYGRYIQARYLSTENINYYAVSNSAGFGLDLTFNKNITKNIYVAFGSRYNNIFISGKKYNRGFTRSETFKMQRGMLTYFLKMGFTLNFLRKSPSLKKEIPTSAELVPLTIRR